MLIHSVSADANAPRSPIHARTSPRTHLSATLVSYNMVILALSIHTIAPLSDFSGSSTLWVLLGAGAPPPCVPPCVPRKLPVFLILCKGEGVCEASSFSRLTWRENSEELWCLIAFPSFHHYSSLPFSFVSLLHFPSLPLLPSPPPCFTSPPSLPLPSLTSAGVPTCLMISLAGLRSSTTYTL